MIKPQSILTGSISGRVAFRSEPARYSQEQPEPLQWLQNTEQQQHEGPGVGDANDANLDGRQADHQQQQQQQQNQFVDPFAGIDIDILPTEVKAKIEAARTEMKKLSGEIGAARNNQGLKDKLQAEVQRLSAELQSKGDGQQQKQDQQDNTIEGQLRLIYKNEGITDAATVEKLVKINAPIMKFMEGRITQGIGVNMAPVANAVINSTANDAFATAVAGDRLGWSKINEVQQFVWDRTQQMTQRGELVSPEVLGNLAYIAYGKYLEEHGFPPNEADSNLQQQQQPRQPQFQPLPNMNQSNGNNPTFTFPGAGSGNLARPPVGSGSNARPLDNETRAAVEATCGNWVVKPKSMRK